MLGGHLDSWHSATGATDNADRLRDDDGGGADPEGDRRRAAAHDPRRAVERRGRRDPRLAGLCEGALRHRSRTRSPDTRSSSRISTSIPAPAARAAPASSARRRPRPSSARRSRRSRISASPARRRRPAARSPAPTARRSTTSGCPGIGFGQDPIEYNTHTHHTNLDNYERVIEDDVKASAIVDRGDAVSARDARRDAAAAAGGGDAAAAGAATLSEPRGPPTRRMYRYGPGEDVQGIVQGRGRPTGGRREEAGPRRQRAAHRDQAGQPHHRRIPVDASASSAPSSRRCSRRSARSPRCSPNARSRSSATRRKRSATALADGVS